MVDHYPRTEYIYRVDSWFSATIRTARGTEAGVLGWGVDGRIFEEENGGEEGADIGACGERAEGVGGKGRKGEGEKGQ